MQHPFEGVMRARQETTGARSTRRALLGRMLGAVAGLLGIATVASAQAPVRRGTTLACGEEGGGVTTYAWGEEGGWRPRRPWWATTYATGEEGGWAAPVPPLMPLVPPVPPIPPVRYPTTLAVGEGGGRS
jgi:hypothetical protein